MTIYTRDFGKLELDENEVVIFRAPIFGFEYLKRFVLLVDDEAEGGLMWLQAVEDPEVCFILLDPQQVGLDYHPAVPEELRATLELGPEDEAAVRLVAVVPGDFRNTTVNLKSPIVINPAKKLAGQVILEEDYPIRMPLFETGVGK